MCWLMERVNWKFRDDSDFETGHLAPWDSGDEVNKAFVEFLTSDAVREQFQ